MKHPQSPAFVRPSVPGAYLALWVAMLERRGYPAQRLLQGTGLTPAALAGQEIQVSPLQFMMVVATSVQLTGDPALGYAFGLEMKPTAHGFLGYALMTCANARDAIRLGERYLRLRAPEQRLRLSLEGEQAVLSLEDQTELAPMRKFKLEVITGAILKAAELLLGEKPDGEIWVDYEEPLYYARCKAQLPPVRFRMPQNQLRFPRGYLERPLALSDPLAARQAVARLEQELRVLGEGGADLPERVRAVLTEAERPFAELSYVAKRVGMSERTLKRHLKLNGSSYQRLLDQVRRDRATALLHDGSVSIDQVALQLGYGDPANFTRAFRKWTGLSPTAWRRQRSG
jgi:AraC-like DNA-binding protein